MNNSMRIFITAFLLMVFVSSIFLGCGGNGTLEEKEPSKERIIISVNRGPKEGDVWLQSEWDIRKKMFEEKYPDYELRISSWDFTPDSFMAKAAGGTLTDIISLWATEGENVIGKGLALDLTERLKDWPLYKEINHDILKPFVYEDRVYGLPYLAYSMALFYNKKLFRENGIVDDKGEPTPPNTWEELVEFAKIITDREKGIAGYGVNGEIPRSGWNFLNYVWQSGGEFEVQEDGMWKAKFNSPEAVSALQFIKDLKWKHGVLQADALAKYDDLWQLFITDKIGMIMEAVTEEILDAIVFKYEFDLDNLGIALLPAGPAGRANQVGADYYIINPAISKEKQDGAFAFITFVHELDLIEAIQKLKNESGRPVGGPRFPVYLDEYQNNVDAIYKRYLNVPDYSSFTNNTNKYIRFEPPYYCQQLYSEVLSPAVQAVTTDSDADPQEIMDEGAKMFQKRFLSKINQ